MQHQVHQIRCCCMGPNSPACSRTQVLPFKHTFRYPLSSCKPASCGLQQHDQSQDGQALTSFSLAVVGPLNRRCGWFQAEHSQSQNALFELGSQQEERETSSQHDAEQAANDLEEAHKKLRHITSPVHEACRSIPIPVCQAVYRSYVC